MAAYKWCADAYLNAALSYLSSNATQLAVISDLGQTAGTDITYAMLSGHILAYVTIDSSDFTQAAGDTSGRKVTIGAQSSISITATGTAVMVVLTNGSNAVYYCTTCSSQSLESGGTVTVPAWDIELRDPA